MPQPVKQSDSGSSGSSGSGGSGSATPTAQSMVYLGTPAGDVPVKVEVVATEAQIEKGLMYRQHLPLDSGMLFLMGREYQWSFWMRNTLIPLDMIFIGKDMKVAGVAADAVPQTEDLRYVDKPSVYVLEVNAGWTRQHGVTPGQRIEIET